MELCSSLIFREREHRFPIVAVAFFVSSWRWQDWLFPACSWITQRALSAQLADNGYQLAVNWDALARQIQQTEVGGQTSEAKGLQTRSFASTLSMASKIMGETANIVFFS